MDNFTELEEFLNHTSGKAAIVGGSLGDVQEAFSYAMRLFPYATDFNRNTMRLRTGTVEFQFRCCWTHRDARRYSWAGFKEIHFLPQTPLSVRNEVQRLAA